MRKLTIKEVKHIAFYVAQKHMEFDEPIPDFSTRNPGVLESCLATAFQTYERKELYPSLVDKAAVIFYLLIKNHPFVNGNKRVAVTSLFTFLFLNEKWISASNEELYQIAVWVAESQPRLKRGVIIAIQDFIRLNLTSLPKQRKN